MIFTLIAIFAGLSYLIGFYAILQNKYRPNLFTRIVWLALAVNNLISVVNLHNQKATIVLALVTLAGSILMFLGSIYRGEKVWTKNETVPSVLLGISLLLWIFTDIPILNLCIGLVAHFLGSIPTVVRVIKNPESENMPFWLFFAVASIIALSVTSLGSIKDYLFAIYFCIFDGSMALLSLRKYIKKS